MKNAAVLLLIFALVVIVSGCVGTNVSSTVKSLPEVQQFLSEHPNASITAALWSESAVNRSINDIIKDCGPQMEVQELWNVKINENNFELKMWLDSNKQPVCVLKHGSNMSETSSPISVSNTAPPVQPISGVSQQQLLCPASCDDNNPCTKDYCSNETGYKCKSDAIASPEWRCNNWSTCSTEGKQARTCTDFNNCKDLANKPLEIQDCVPSPAACGGDGQSPCSDGCDYGYELIDSVCKKECAYGQIRVSGTCQECGGENQIPCKDNKCDYGYELIDSKCVKTCGYGQTRISGVCTDTGGLNEPCGPNSKCDYGSVCKNNICVASGGENQPCNSDGTCDYSKVCKNDVCVKCGQGAGQPCCAGENKCLSYPTTTCVNDVCTYCGREGEQCCETNKCNVGKVCKSGICESCGGASEQCCSPDNPYICFIGSCTNGLCVY